MTAPCGHLETIAGVDSPADGCVTCLEIGSTWHHLRQCLQCGVTLCCDSSPNQHMSGHHRSTGHPIMRSGQPGEDWGWCYVDEVSLRPVARSWQTFDPFLETGTMFAAEHLAAGGDLGFPQAFVTEDGFPLGEWLGHAREQHAKGELDPAEAAAIEALPGWTWGPPSTVDASTSRP
jgi:hypothetical protein